MMLMQPDQQPMMPMQPGQQSAPMHQHSFYKNKYLDKPRPGGTPALQFECAICERPGIENDIFAWTCGKCKSVNLCTFCVVDSVDLNNAEIDVTAAKARFD